MSAADADVGNAIWSLTVLTLRAELRAASGSVASLLMTGHSPVLNGPTDPSVRSTE